MADKSFGVKEINLIGASGTPSIDSPNNLNINAVNVAISTDLSVGGNFGVDGLSDLDELNVAGVSTFQDKVRVGGATAFTEDLVVTGSARVTGILTIGTSSITLDGNTNQLSIGSSSIISETGTASFNEINVTGVITASSFIGDGSNLTGINAGIGTDGSVDTTGIITASAFYGDGSNLISGRWTLGANGTSDYTFTGIGFTQTTNDPTLYLKKGEVYEFVNNSGGSHPFQIRESNGGAAYNNGVTNNGAASGTITFEVPYNAPDSLYYQCVNHSNMGGDITILGGGSLDALSDVDTTTTPPTDGQALVWDNANSQWEPGTISGGIGTDGSVNTSGIITASAFYGDGSNLTGVSGGIGTDGSVNTSGIITASAFYGDGSNLTGVSGGIGTDGSVNTTGIITASAFYGDGSNLTGVSGGGNNYYSDNLWPVDPNYANLSLGIHADGNFNDHSTNLFVPTVFGNTAINTNVSRFGSGSIEFDGSTDYVRYAFDTALDLNSASAWAISFWIKPGLTTARRIMGSGGGTVAWNSTNGLHWILGTGGTPADTVNFQWWDGTSSRGMSSSAGSVSLTGWTHVAVTWDGTTIRLFANGNLEASDTTAPVRPSTDPVLDLGTIPGENGGGNLGYNGYLDDIYIYKGAAVWTANFTPPTSPLGTTSSGSLVTLDALSDVDTATTPPTDGQALVWDNANSQWEPGTISGGIGTDGSVNTTGIITASAFYGDGSNLTGVSGGTTGLDPLFSSVTVLASFDGETNGASTWTTVGSTSPTWTANGATITNTITRWNGTTSLSVGAGAPSIPCSLGSSDFTIEAWVWMDLATYSSFGSVFRNGVLADTFDVFYFGPNGSTTSARIRISNSSSTLAEATGNCVWQDEEWNHVAICRAGNTYSAYVNGDKVGSDVSGSSQTFNSGNLTINASGSSTGYIQDFRVTLGVSRYSTQYYQVPTFPFPQSSGGSGGATAINDLSDVDTITTPPTDGQALVWDNANSQWEPGTISGGIGTDGSVNTSGIITASAFYGDGSNLTGINAGIGTDGSVNTSGIITASAFYGDGSNLTGVSGGASSQWVTYPAGISTTSNVGIGTTVISAKLTLDVGTGVTAFDIQGSAGQLFSVTNNLTSGSIFSVNDVSGIPSIDVDADGTIQLAPLGATEYVGIGTTNPTAKLDVNGTVNVTGILTATSFSGDGSALTGIESYPTWTLGANGTTDYTFTGIGFTVTTNDPVVYLARGQKYAFNNQSGGSHPFEIRVSDGGTAYNHGVTNNGAATGTIVFEVPFNAPSTLFYQCTSHSGMGNTIRIYPDLI